MKKIKLYITASLDGYIARPDGDLDWLLEFPKVDYGYKYFFESVDTVIMGGRAYREITCMDIIYPYKDKTTYIVAHNPFLEKENVNYITENVIETISRLRNEEGKDILLAGGGELTSMLLNQDLIDEMIITYLPVILGNGIPLFSKSLKESNWKLLDNKSFENGALVVKYQKSGSSML